MLGWTKDQRYCTICATTVLLGFLALALYLSPESPPPISQTAQQASRETSNQKQPEGFWRKVTADPPIAFTGILALATAILAFASDTLRLTSFFRVYDPERRRFVRAPGDDEYEDWEYED